MEQYDRRQDEAEDHRKRTGERCEHGARARQAIAWKSLVAARSMVIAGVTAAAAFEQDQQEDEPEERCGELRRGHPAAHRETGPVDAGREGMHDSSDENTYEIL